MKLLPEGLPSVHLMVSTALNTCCMFPISFQSFWLLFLVYLTWPKSSFMGSTSAAAPVWHLLFEKGDDFDQDPVTFSIRFFKNISIFCRSSTTFSGRRRNRNAKRSPREPCTEYQPLDWNSFSLIWNGTSTLNRNLMGWVPFELYFTVWIPFTWEEENPKQTR